MKKKKQIRVKFYMNDGRIVNKIIPNIPWSVKDVNYYDVKRFRVRTTYVTVED